jgi:hypothetical protein
MTRITDLPTTLASGRDRRPFSEKLRDRRREMAEALASREVPQATREGGAIIIRMVPAS